MILQQRRDRSSSLRTGFTLMEVLVVVAILVILAGISIGLFAFLDQGKEGAAKLQIANLEKAVKAYSMGHNGNFPGSLQELTQMEGGKKAYLDHKDLLDPWNRPFVYDQNQTSPKGDPLIYSQGANPGNQAGWIRNWTHQ